MGIVKGKRQEGRYCLIGLEIIVLTSFTYYYRDPCFHRLRRSRVRDHCARLLPIEEPEEKQ